MPPLRVLIVDDEPPAVELLATLTSEVAGFSVVATAHDVPSAYAQLKEQSIDLVLLDISMPDQDGFALIDQIGIENMPFVIFVTAHSDHALRAFDVRALDYVLKPPTVARFQSALQRAAELISTRPQRERQPRLREIIRQLERTTAIPTKGEPDQPATVNSTEYLVQLVVKTRDGFLKIAVDSVLWCEAEDHYVRIHQAQKSHLYTGNLTMLSQQLDPSQFARVRRDAMIRYDAIQSVRTGTFGTLEITLSNQQKLTTSRSLDSQIKLNLLAHAKSPK